VVPFIGIHKDLAPFLFVPFSNNETKLFSPDVAITILVGVWNTIQTTTKTTTRRERRLMLVADGVIRTHLFDDDDKIFLDLLASEDDVS
jgi:hypothetical protein